MTQFDKKEVIKNLRRKNKEQKDKLEAIKELVEKDLNQIPMNIDFRREFYKITGFTVPDWFKEDDEDGV
jgi:hypothetical protein